MAQPRRSPWYASGVDYDVMERQKEEIRAQIRTLSDADLVESLRDVGYWITQHGYCWQQQCFELCEGEAQRFG